MLTSVQKPPVMPPEIAAVLTLEQIAFCEGMTLYTTDADVYDVAEVTDAILYDRISGLMRQWKQKRENLRLVQNPRAGKGSADDALLIVRTANEWIAEARNAPALRQLFGTFWHEGEFCVLFGETGCGKSILTVQLCEALAHGASILGLPVAVPPQKVLYLDCELSPVQFRDRYSDTATGDSHRFSDNFLRVEINSNAAPRHFESELLSAIEAAAIEAAVHIVIVDNLTFLGNELEKSDAALSLVKSLKAMKSKHGLSLLVLGHTPKRDASRELTRNDLSGSRNLLNFVDSAFAIGFSTQSPSKRYLKQVKVRQTALAHGADNVLIADIEKRGNFTGMSPAGYSPESEHLQQAAFGRPSKLDSVTVADVFGADSELTAAQVQARLKIAGLKQASAYNWIKQSVETGKIVSPRYGVYTVSEVPF